MDDIVDTKTQFILKLLTGPLFRISIDKGYAYYPIEKQKTYIVSISLIAIDQKYVVYIRHKYIPESKVIIYNNFNDFKVLNNTLKNRSHEY